MLEFALYVLMEVILYGIGRIVIAVLSLGHARTQTFKETATAYYRFYSEEDGKTVFSHMAASMIGALTLTAIITLAIALRN